MPDVKTERVLVTGSTGYIARHAVVQLLDHGYAVRGTARSVSSVDQLRDDLVAHLADVRNIDDFEIVACDLIRDDGWTEAAAGCTYVLHIASPIPAEAPKDPSELIVPARDGALRVLRAAQGAGVRRVVMTSSLAAVVYGTDRTGRVFTEADWSDPEDRRIGAYEQSKTIAERAAWDFMTTEANNGMELATINPGVVLGPMFGNAPSTSSEVVAKLMNRDFPACPNFTFSMVDVRDVAAAHIAAMESPNAAGQRYLCGTKSHSLREIAAILARHYGPQGFRIPTAKLPSFAVRVVALFDKTVALAMNDLDNPPHIDNSKVVQLLGRPLRDLEEMVTSMADSLIEYKLVKAHR